MPWTPEDAKRHTKKATSSVSQRQWSEVANSMLKRGFSEGRAVRAANSVIKKRGTRHKRGRRGGR